MNASSVAGCNATSYRVGIRKLNRHEKAGGVQMGLLDPDWQGLARTFARGPHSTEPTDPQYARSYDVVPGSLDRPVDDLIQGSYHPGRGQARVGVPVNARISGDTVFFDRMVLPEPAADALKPVSWVAENRSIEPTSVPLSELSVTRDADGLRTIEIPEADGGGVIRERPNAYRGRINDASPAEQIRALKGWFSDPIWRR